MVTRTVIIDNEEYAKEFDALVAKLSYVTENRVLKAEDVALGIGMPYTKEELDLFLSEDKDDLVNIDLHEAKKYILNKLGSNGNNL